MSMEKFKEKCKIIAIFFGGLFVMILCIPAVYWIDLKAAYRRWRAARVQP